MVTGVDYSFAGVAGCYSWVGRTTATTGTSTATGTGYGYFCCSSFGFYCSDGGGVGGGVVVDYGSVFYSLTRFFNDSELLFSSV